MVDVTSKEVTLRRARAEALVRAQPATVALLQSGSGPKGNVFEAARLAGINAAKQTWQLIPLCHPLPLEFVQVEFTIVDQQTVRVETTACAHARTGVEMEALTAAAVAALTIYDMCKAVDKEMTVETIRLLEKTGGKSGRFVRQEKS